MHRLVPAVEGRVDLHIEPGDTHRALHHCMRSCHLQLEADGCRQVCVTVHRDRSVRHVDGVPQRRDFTCRWRVRPGGERLDGGDQVGGVEIGRECPNAAAG